MQNKVPIILISHIFIGGKVENRREKYVLSWTLFDEFSNLDVNRFWKALDPYTGDTDSKIFICFIVFYLTYVFKSWFLFLFF